MPGVTPPVGEGLNRVTEINKTGVNIMTGLNTLETLRQPEYTGENRCFPCTVVNAVLAVGFAVVVASLLGAGVGWEIGIVAATFVLVVSAGSIYLRGYLVPGTPWLTKTYFPEWVLRRFDKHSSPEPPVDEEFDVESVLLRAGALEPCEHSDDLCLTDDFEAAWNDRISAAKSDAGPYTELAQLLDVEPDRLDIEEYQHAFVAKLDTDRIGQWESRAAFLADVAAGAALQERLRGWGSLDVRQRHQLLQGLRVFLEECPACAGTVTMDEETVESCCRSIDVVAVSCQECGARVLEIEHPGQAA